MIKFDSFNNFNIVLIHPAGGTTYCFNKLVKYINKANIYTVSYPKRYGEKGIDYLALLYKKELEATGLLNKSTILVGYSFGGNVALKIAEDFHMLKALWLIDTYPPESYTISNLDNKAYQRVFPEIWLSMTGKLEKLTPELRDKLKDKDITQIVYLLKQEKLIDQNFSVSEVIDLFNMWCSHHRALGE